MAMIESLESRTFMSASIPKAALTATQIQDRQAIAALRVEITNNVLQRAAQLRANLTAAAVARFDRVATLAADVRQIARDRGNAAAVLQDRSKLLSDSAELLGAIRAAAARIVADNLTFISQSLSLRADLIAALRKYASDVRLHL